MNIFKFIVEILPGKSWLEPGGFHASDLGITNERAETAGQQDDWTFKRT